LTGSVVPEATSDEIKNMRAENAAMKETMAELLMENRQLNQNHDRGWRKQ
jgi:hypothetical protein